MSAPLAGQTTIFGYSPQQFQGAYGVNQISFGGTQGTGAGQTIALIEAGGYPNLYSALAVLRCDLGHCRSAQLCRVQPERRHQPASADPGWSLEIALDVEIAHAMAPDANIDVVEASDSILHRHHLMQAANTAATSLARRSCR